jgi:GW (Gly-Tryp) dipeptide domain
MNRRLAALGLSLAVVACTRDRAQPAESRDPALAPAPAEPRTPPPSVAQPADGDAISGQVVETMNAASYTYAKLDRNGTQIWIAGPETKLAVGTRLGKMTGSLMTAFRSETLKRTFDQIYFVNGFAIEGGAPAVAMPATPAMPAAPAGDELAGTVLETMNAGGYTYAQLDRNGTKLWIAGPETKLAVGTKLGKMTGSLMTDFSSPSLKRTFDKIYFVAAYNGDALPGPPNPHGPKPADPGEPIEKVAAAPGGKTIADVYAQKKALAGTPVVVRGKIVKLNNAILGKNWIRVRDGSGAAGTNELLVTSQATGKLGDIVVVRGKVALDQDFGAGYRYDVLVEEATLASQ